MRISIEEAKKLFGDNPKISSQFVSPKKKSKYRNYKVYVYENGFVSYQEKNPSLGTPIQIFDSIKEFDRWNELLLMQKAKIISNLDRQKDLIINESGVYQGKEVKKISYKADFTYIRNGKQVVEDVKPFDAKTQKYKTTKDFNLKWKMLKLKYPDYIFELF